MPFRLSSPAFSDGDPIPARHSCTGEDISPPLGWDEAPPGTRSFALICEDPDAPRGTFRHWAIFDIPADRPSLPEGIRPIAETADGLRQAVNDFGVVGWRGPCPPRGHGTHHYHFRLLALDVHQLAVDRDANCRAVAVAAEEHVLGLAELVGLFQR